MNDTEFCDLICKLVNSTDITETQVSADMLLDEAKTHPSHSTKLLEFLISAKWFALLNGYTLGLVWCNTLQDYNCHKLIRIEVTSPDNDKIMLEGISDGWCRECKERYDKDNVPCEPSPNLDEDDFLKDEDSGADGNPLSTAPNSLF